MTEQEQRICIAEACGFQRWFGGNDVILCKPRDNRQRQYWLDSGSVIVDRPVDSMREVPDYLNDLNAMHSAVTTQPYRFKLAFNQELHATASTLGCLVCELKAADWAACFLTVERDRRKLNA